LDEQEKAYLAGIVDGEGSIFVGKTYKRLNTMMVNVSNTDPRLHMWLKNHVGGSVTEEKRRFPNRRKVWLWQISSNKAADMLEQIFPYLVIKKDQAETAIAFQKLKQNANRRGGNGKLSHEEYQWRLDLYQKLKDLKTVQWAATTERGGIKFLDEATVCTAPKDAERTEMILRQAKFKFIN
jgi:hypothetical protein